MNLSREKIMEVLKDGGKIVIYDITWAIRLKDKNDNDIKGAIRFDTYCKLHKDNLIKESKGKYLERYFVIA